MADEKKKKKKKSSSWVSDLRRSGMLGSQAKTFQDWEDKHGSSSYPKKK